MISRRDFLSTTATAIALSAAPPDAPAPDSPAEHWYRRVTRWGQTNITE